MSNLTMEDYDNALMTGGDFEESLSAWCAWDECEDCVDDADQCACECHTEEGE